MNPAKSKGAQLLKTCLEQKDIQNPTRTHHKYLLGERGTIIYSREPHHEMDVNQCTEKVKMLIRKRCSSKNAEGYEQLFLPEIHTNDASLIAWKAHAERKDLRTHD